MPTEPLVKSSVPTDLHTMEDGMPQRIKAVNSVNDIIRTTTQYLIDHFGTLSTIRDSHLLTFNRNGERQFVQVTPWQDPLGLDWLIVVVVPESDFMAKREKLIDAKIN